VVDDADVEQAPAQPRMSASASQSSEQAAEGCVVS
jgi:hypothetical protein